VEILYIYIFFFPFDQLAVFKQRIAGDIFLYMGAEWGLFLRFLGYSIDLEPSVSGF